MANMQFFGTLPENQPSRGQQNVALIADAISKGTQSYMATQQKQKDLDMEQKKLDIQREAVKPYERFATIEEEKLKMQGDSELWNSFQQDLSKALDGNDIVSSIQRWGPILDTTAQGTKIKKESGRTITELLNEKLGGLGGGGDNTTPPPGQNGVTNPSRLPGMGTSVVPVGSGTADAIRQRDTANFLQLNPTNMNSMVPNSKPKREYKGYIYEKREDGLWHKLLPSNLS